MLIHMILISIVKMPCMGKEVSPHSVMKVKMLVDQSCLTLCDPMDCSPPGSSVHGIFREKHWSGLLFPTLGDLPDPRIKPGSSILQAESLPSEPPGELLLVY